MSSIVLDPVGICLASSATEQPIIVPVLRETGIDCVKRFLRVSAGGFHRIWSTDWFRNPGREAARLLTAIREAAEQQQIAEASVGEGGISGRPSEQTEDDADQRQDAQESDRPPARPSNVETYEEVALTVPHGRELLELSVSEIGRLGLEVVKAEGPIHLDEVARRIREAFGLQKTGGRILTHVRDGLIYHKRDGGVACEDEFWSVAGRETQKIRDRRVRRCR